MSDEDRISGRSVAAQSLADAKNAGSPAMTSSPWSIAAGTTMSARPMTDTKKAR